MKKLLLSSAFLFSLALHSQTFSGPESVEPDAVYHRWIVGNNNLGTIVSDYPASATTLPFYSSPALTTGPHGIEIMGSTAYVCDGAYLRGYALSNGANTFNINCGATFLNGLTTDGSNYLFATDFTAKKIYRINPAANSYNIMASTTKTPNGIYYDGANNRCVFVTWGTNAPIQAMSLADSTISTLTTTTLSNCDGVTKDMAGYWYVTSWGNNSLNRFTPTFTSPTVVMSGLNSPADIGINAAGDSIGIPNNGGTTVVFYTGITTSANIISQLIAVSVFPDPAADILNISLGEKYFSGTAEIYSADGKFISSDHFAGRTKIISVSELAGGIYFLALKNDTGEIVAREKFVVE
ncbi:MAG: T9SS type A sorting domain-containing protein [Bacteroidetes bacterium]|nr:T9SS type A sorting domain-containing protein [Bacteroidota bacterium]